MPTRIFTQQERGLKISCQVHFYCATKRYVCIEPSIFCALPAYIEPSIVVLLIFCAYYSFFLWGAKLGSHEALCTCRFRPYRKKRVVCFVCQVRLHKTPNISVCDIYSGSLYPHLVALIREDVCVGRVGEVLCPPVHLLCHAGHPRTQVLCECHQLLHRLHYLCHLRGRGRRRRRGWGEERS